MEEEGPVVAIVGATGNVGGFVTPEFLEALSSGRIKELRILSTKESDATKDLEAKGAKLYIVEFQIGDTSLVSALEGVDVVVSTMGTGPGSKESRKALLDALVTANVKIYFPSEFGTNIYSRCKDYTHPIFEEKKEHFNASKAKGITTIAIICNLIMETSFGEWLGMNFNEGKWTIVGTGDIPVATCAQTDIAKFTLEAVLKAFRDPSSVPEHLECYSDIQTLKDYAKAFDTVSGSSTTFEYIDLDQAVSDYNESQDFLLLLQILMEEGAFNIENPKGNQLFNTWELRKIESYAKEKQN